MQLALTPHEARLLLRHLLVRIEDLDGELVRTDKFELQHDLARELDALRSIAEGLRLLVVEEARIKVEALPR